MSDRKNGWQKVLERQSCLSSPAQMTDLSNARIRPRDMATDPDGEAELGLCPPGLPGVAEASRRRQLWKRSLKNE